MSTRDVNQAPLEAMERQNLSGEPEQPLDTMEPPEAASEGPCAEGGMFESLCDHANVPSSQEAQSSSLNKSDDHAS